MPKKTKAVEGATEVALKKPLDNTIVLKANQPLSAAAYQLIVDRVDALNKQWDGEIKFVLIPHTTDVQE